MMSAVEAIGSGMPPEWDDLLDQGAALVRRYREALSEAKRTNQPSESSVACVEAKRAVGEHLKKMLAVARGAGRTMQPNELVAILQSRRLPPAQDAPVPYRAPTLFSHPPVATLSPRHLSASTTLVFMDGR